MSLSTSSLSVTKPAAPYHAVPQAVSPTQADVDALEARHPVVGALLEACLDAGIAIGEWTTDSDESLDDVHREADAARYRFAAALLPILDAAAATVIAGRTVVGTQVVEGDTNSTTGRDA